VLAMSWVPPTPYRGRGEGRKGQDHDSWSFGPANLVCVAGFGGGCGLTGWSIILQSLYLERIIGTSHRLFIRRRALSAWCFLFLHFSSRGPSRLRGLPGVDLPWIKDWAMYLAT